jgi:ribonuclease HI
MNERSREILRFIARHEPLERTLQNFPDLDRAQLTELLLGLAAGRASRSRAEAGRRGAAPAPEPRRTGGDKELCLYTDGASRGNPGLAGAGIQIIDSAGEPVLERAVFLGEATNNVAELTGILHALTLIPKHAPTVIYTDSQYAIGVLGKGWKAKANQELIADIKVMLKGRAGLEFVYVRGHVGVPLNERADELARQAISQRRSHAPVLEPVAE